MITGDIARAMVLADQRAADPNGWETDAEILAWVRNTLRLPDAPAVPGSYPLYDDGSELALAYRLVLTGAA